MLARALRQAVVAAAVAGALLNPAAHASTITVGPYTPTSSPFIVPIVVTGAVDLASFTFDLNFDPAAYQINTACDRFADAACDFVTGPVTLGTFYTGAASFAPLFNPGFILLDAMGAQTGELVGVNGAWQDSGPAPSGDGVLAFIEFIGIAGTTPASPIEVVGAPPPPPPGGTVPEPSTVALLFAGLALIRWRRPEQARRGNDVVADTILASRVSAT